MSNSSDSFWDNLRREIKAIGTDTRASDMRRFKAYMIDRVFAMEEGVKIKEALLKSQEQKLQAAEENLTECASNYWKEVEKRKAAEESLKELQEQAVTDVAIREKLLHENEILREAVEFYAHEKPTERYSEGSVMKNHSWDIACCACIEKPVGKKARQALEKVKRGGE